MLLLLAGLVLFLGVHSVRIIADPRRSAMVVRLGPLRWRGLYSLFSLAGFVLLVWGYGHARADPVLVWTPPIWTRYATSILMLPSFVLIVAGNMSGTRMKVALGHPMLLGTLLWAFAHLLSNGMLADIVLFGGFLVWAGIDYGSARQRDRNAGTIYPPGSLKRDAIAVLIGTVAWIVFVLGLHRLLIGVQPF